MDKPASNNKKSGLASALLLALAWSIPAHADPLSWEASVQEAAANNADLRAARANLESADYSASAAYRGFFPQVSAGASYTDTSGASSTSPTYVGSSYSASLTATQNLFAGFQDTARVGQGAANRQAAAGGLSLARARLSQALKAAFAGLKYVQDSVALAATIVQRQDQNLRLVELRFESGRENKGSVLLTRAALAQARLDQLQARQALATARAQLAQTLGRTDAESLDIVGGVPTAEPGPTPDFDAIARQAPGYAQALAQEQAAAAGVTLARSALYPSLNLTGSVARAGTDWFPQDDRRSVGLNLTVPLFSGGGDYYATRAAQANLDAAGAAAQTVLRQLLVDLKSAYAGYVQADEKLKVDQAFVDAAQLRAEIARNQYNNGLISFNDWNLIENDLIQRQKSFVQSQRDRVVAEAAWEQAQGKGVIP